MKHRVYLATGIGFLALTFQADGAAIFVTTAQQKISGSGGCSLQEAIYSANLQAQVAITGYDFATNTALTVNTPQCARGTGNDTIVLPAGALFLLTRIVDDAGNPTGPAATPMITSTITIEANGATLQWSGALRARLFAVGGTGRLTIRNAYIKGFTTKGGNGADGGGGGLGAGGAIYVMQNGVLSVDSSTFDSNVAIGGNGSAYFADAGGGGGGLSGNGSAPVNATLVGGGGGGGSRGNGFAGFISDPIAYGGGGGGTVTNAAGLSGGETGGGPGGNTGPVPCTISDSNGDNGGPGGGGGGGGGPIGLIGCFAGGNAGSGGYGGGGGGGGDPAGSGNGGGFGGGGGSASNNDALRATGGNAGFGGGGGSGDSLFGGPGHGYPTLGGDADGTHGGGGSALGGAIFNDSGSVTVKNSTFANNVAVRGVSGGGSATNGIDAGGAIFSRNGILEVINSTVSANQGTGSGAGIVAVGDPFASFTLNDTIIYGNGAQECFVRGGVAMAGVGNLIGGNGNGGPLFVPCPGALTAADPRLGPLQLNFPGSTPTMAIALGGPAQDTADPSTSLSVDQRGEPRPSLGGFDIGAFETCLERFGPLLRVCVPPPVIQTTNLLTVVVTGNGTTNPAPGSYSDVENSVVPLAAAPNPGNSFLNWTGNVADTLSASTTVVMNMDQTVTANFVAGSTILGGNILTKSGPLNARVWPVNIANANVSPVTAHYAQVDALTLMQVAGPACTPVLITPLPAVAGDLAPGTSATTNLILNFTGCSATTRFTAQATFSANGGGVTGSMTRTNQFP